MLPLIPRSLSLSFFSLHISQITQPKVEKWVFQRTIHHTLCSMCSHFTPSGSCSSSHLKDQCKIILYITWTIPYPFSIYYNFIFIFPSGSALVISWELVNIVCYRCCKMIYVNVNVNIQLQHYFYIEGNILPHFPDDPDKFEI